MKTMNRMAPSLVWKHPMEGNKSKMVKHQLFSTIVAWKCFWSNLLMTIIVPTRSHVSSQFWLLHVVYYVSYLNWLTNDFIQIESSMHMCSQWHWKRASLVPTTILRSKDDASLEPILPRNHRKGSSRVIWEEICLNSSPMESWFVQPSNAIYIVGQSSLDPENEWGHDDIGQWASNKLEHNFALRALNWSSQIGIVA